MARPKVRLSRRQALAQKWRPLYEVAERIKELAPWQWMDEMDNFGVQDPESGEIGFVSVMGKLGEHFSIAVYLGVTAIHQFWELEELAGSDDSWEITSRLMLIPQMQLSFEDRDLVEKEDAGIMRKLKLKYSGRNAYPLFRTIKPGCPLWFLDMDRIPFLIHVLEQTVAVASRYREDESLLYPGNNLYLLRVLSNQDGKIRWSDEIRPIPEPETRIMRMDIDMEALEALQQVPRVGNSVEIDLFMLMDAIQEKRGAQPYYPFALLMVEADSGMILSHKTLSPLPSIDEMYTLVPQKVIELLLGNKMLPYEVHTQSPLLTAVLAPLFAQLNTPLIEKPSLPMLNEAKAAMFEHFGRDFR